MASPLTLDQRRVLLTTRRCGPLYLRPWGSWGPRGIRTVFGDALVEGLCGRGLLSRRVTKSGPIMVISRRGREALDEAHPYPGLGADS